MDVVEYLEKENASLKEEIESAQEQIDILLQIIDEDDLGIKYSPIVLKALDLFPQDRKALIRHEIEKANKREKEYYQEVKKIWVMENFGTMPTTQSDLADYILENFEYEKTDDDLLSFMQKKKGKCWHLSHLFRDLCKLDDYECYVCRGILDGSRHAWNKILINELGQTYYMYFDLTLELTKPSTEKRSYLFMSESDMEEYIELSVS
jgi:uncharacterized protein (DUF2225 family)